MNHNKNVARLQWGLPTHRPTHKQTLALERFSEPLRHGQRIRLFDITGLAVMLFCFPPTSAPDRR